VRTCTLFNNSRRDHSNAEQTFYSFSQNSYLWGFKEREGKYSVCPRGGALSPNIPRYSCYILLDVPSGRRRGGKWATVSLSFRGTAVRERSSFVENRVACGGSTLPTAVPRLAFIFRSCFCDWPYVSYWKWYKSIQKAMVQSADIILTLCWLSRSPNPPVVRCTRKMKQPHPLTHYIKISAWDERGERQQKSKALDG